MHGNLDVFWGYIKVSLASQRVHKEIVSVDKWSLSAYQSTERLFPGLTGS